ncbi:Hpt domain-containing protein [Acinetobacter puyangensis]|uniref:Hpt domain-containing protein n=1 Tax=Acinetobacter puyangensis TaxID=1096779 RepID=UPI003A4DCAA8
MNEVLKELISHIELPTDQLKDQDPEIREIFIEEVQEIIEFLDSVLPQWLDNPSNQVILTDIRRSYHTLKGSGRMAGAMQSAELAWAVEEMLNRVIAGVVALNKDVQELVYSVAILYKTLVQDLETDFGHCIDIRPWIVAANRLRDTQAVEPILRFSIDYYHTQNIPTEAIIDGVHQDSTIQPAIAKNLEQLEKIGEFKKTQSIEVVKEIENKEEMKGVEDQTLEIFLEESAEHLQIISSFLHLQHEPSVEEFNQLIRAVHTIRGSSGMVGVDSIFVASSNVENVFKHIDQDRYPQLNAEKQLLLEYHEYVNAYLGVLPDDKASDQLALLDQAFVHTFAMFEADYGVDSNDNTTQGLVSKLLDLGINDLLDAEFAFVEEAQAGLTDYLISLLEQAEILQPHLNAKQTESLRKITQYLEQCYQALLTQEISVEQHLDVLIKVQALHQYLIDAFDGLASGQNIAITHLIEAEFEQVLSDIQEIDISYRSLALTDNVWPIGNTYDSTLSEDPKAQGVDTEHADIESRDHLQTQHANTVFDAELLDIFLEESDELVVAMDADFNLWEQNPENTQVLKDLFRYLHTLKGGANMIQATHLGEIAHELESIYERILNGRIQPSVTAMQSIRYAQDEIAARLQQLRDHAIDEDNPDLIASLRAISHAEQSGLQAPQIIVHDDANENTVDQTAPSVLSDHVDSVQDQAQDADQDQSTAQQHVIDFEWVEPNLSVQQAATLDQAHQVATSQDEQQYVEPMSEPQGFDDELLAIFLEESDELVAAMDTDFNAWQQDPENTQLLKNLFRYLHTLKGGANMVQASHLGEIAHELENIYERVLNGQVSPSTQVMQTIRYVQDDIAIRLQKLRDQSIDEANPALIADLHRIAAGETVADLSIQSFVQHKQSDVVEPVSVKIQDQHSVETALLLSEIPTDKVDSTIPPLLAHAIAEGDEEKIVIVESYIEEAQELLQQGETVFEQWRNDRNNRRTLLTLQRAYHTLKGNSRVVHEQLIADIAYQLETVFERFSIHQFTSERYDHLIQQAQAWLYHAILNGSFDDASELKARLQAIKYQDSLLPADEELGSETIDFATVAQYDVVQGDGSTPPPMYAEVEKNQETQAQEQIRISADLVEKMIDLSGESAINRSRIELDLGQMNFTLSEMELAIQRLADQLRRMEGELETQILVKHEITGQRYGEFDPLEMDQYSALNQLSKSLAESASDLIDFKTTLSEKIRDTENLLLQQSRIQNELQQSLMGTRLVPFTRLLPRLQRLVRQTSTQLNRPVELNIENTEGELDRNILERLVSPLEHMLRNAIDHGIEDPETRKQLGKSTTGHINLNIAREANDILIIFSDDGHGIDVAAVKHKAEQNGLITAGMQISDVDLMQYIFHSGLTTAQKVTQISGRGVGLDVVQSEIKSLGGHISVNSELGKGTEFTIRVPTTVAVSDALMVRVGEQQFALPLAQIERIVRVSPVALAEYYDSKAEQFELDQTSYRLRYVGEFVTGQAKPVFNNMGSSVPVIIFNSAGRSVALQVDQLVGSRAQIVIKPIGKQMSSVGSVGGATILADGRVCLILDGQNIARLVLTTARAHRVEQIVQQPAEIRASRRTILVVDDSVTVRKVTSRLLERNGFDVVTAKDGVEAIEKLALITPDLMLLDIEMPRMDGFEVANYIRHDSQHKHLPIIMITSRTGEKHREHALSLGVNDYMGKPFQEAELLDNIHKILGMEKVF